MQNVSCPSCGAPVTFRSHASVMAVCAYCQATLLKDADSVKNLGRMSDILEDYSPLQIGTSGRYGKQNFTLVGRIQLRYSNGMWNEWYVLFDDGASGWLGDSSGLYTLTIEKRGMQTLPTFEEIVPSHNYYLDGQNYTAAEKRSAQCIAGQGELPFKVGPGWQADVADFRGGSRFMTLDYSDLDLPGNTTRGTRTRQPKAYTGSSVRLDQMHCQLLRDDDTLQAASGKFHGKVDSLACPACGHAIQYLPNLTATLVCPSCHTQLDAASPSAQILAAGYRMEQVHTTLTLGAKANIAGVPHTIIGLMQRSDDEDTPWTEYLLHNARSGFLWLIETDEGWARARVQGDWPVWRQGDTAQLGNRPFKQLYDYTAHTVFVAGAFNWRVNVGDETRVIEFSNGPNKLAAEITPQEITWSQSSPVAADQIRAWFGAHIQADKSKPADLMTQARNFIYWLLILNIIPLVFVFDEIWLPLLIAMLAIYLPAKYLSIFGEGSA